MFGSGGFGFGQQQQQPAQSTPQFGAFGQQPAATQQSAFGASAPVQTGFGFGAQPSTTAFGTTQAAPSTGFGTTSAFGQNTASGFGSSTSTPFGHTSAFGAPAQPTGFGMGSSTNAFGVQQPQTQGGGLFGQSSTAFGGTSAFGSAAPKTPLFGTGSTGFGGPQTSSAFGGGAPSNMTSDTVNNGTGNPSFVTTHERESTGTSSVLNIYHSISCMPAYKNWSFEELRVKDYELGKKHAGATSTAQASTSAFGSTNVGSFGQPQTQSTFGAFGQAAQPTQPATSAFGSTSSTFGSAPTATPAFGQSQPAFGGFGQTVAHSTNAMFGQQQPQTAAPAFGQASTGIFGQAQQTQGPSAFGGFGQAQQPTQTTSTFGGFGQPSATSQTNSLFGSAQPAASSTSFGKPATQPTSLFGAPATGSSMFGAPATTQAPSIFGTPAATAQPAGGLFGKPAGFGTSTSQPSTPSIFGASTAPTMTQSSFTPSGGMFATPAAPSTSLFGAPAASSTSIFGSAPKPTGTNTSSMQPSAPSSFFSAPPATGSLFGQPQQQPSTALQATVDKNPYGNNPLFNVPVSVESLQKRESPIAIPVKIPAAKAAPLPPHFSITPKSVSKLKLRGFTPSLMSSRKSDGTPSYNEKDVGTLALEPAFTPRRNMKKLVLDLNDTSSVGGKASPRNAASMTESARKSVSFDSRLEKDSAIKSAPVNTTQYLHQEDNTDGSPMIPDTPTPVNHIQPHVSPNIISSPAKNHGYSFIPSLEELMELSDDQLRAVENFQIKHAEFGSVQFLQPVDLLSASPSHDRKGIKNIPEKIVKFSKGMLSVYPDDDENPGVGYGLNVPAKIKLYNCWATDRVSGEYVKDKSTTRWQKHVEKLETIPDTKYLGFHNEGGIWSFKVQHFSRYGLESDSDEDVETKPIQTIDKSSASASSAYTETPSKANFKSPSRKSLSIDESGSFFEGDSFAHVRGSGAPRREYVNDLRLAMVKEVDVVEDEDSVDEEDSTKEYYEEEIDVIGSEEEEDSYADESYSSSSSETFSDTSSSILNKSNAVPDESLRISELDYASAGEVEQSISKIGATPLRPGSTFSATPVTLYGTDKRRRQDWSGDDQSVPVLTKKTLFAQSPENEISASKSEDFEVPARLSHVPSMRESIYFSAYEEPNTKFTLTRSFRVGWSNKGEILVCRPVEIREDKKLNFRQLIIHWINFAGSENNIDHEKNRCQILLNQLLNYSTFRDGDSIDEKKYPLSVILSSTLYFERLVDSVLSSQLRNSSMFSNYESGIWKLAATLWDPLYTIDSLSDRLLETEYQAIIQESIRKEMVSNWLKEAVKDVTLKQVDSLNASQKSIEVIFQLLCARQLKKALETAANAKFYKLALILSQIGGASSSISVKTKSGHVFPTGHGLVGHGGMDDNSREFIVEQLRIWKAQYEEWDGDSNDAGSLIPQNILQLWALCSGEISEWTPEFFKLLDWKRSFGLYLWYANGGRNSISKALEIYEQTFTANPTMYPLPQYIEMLPTKERRILLDRLKNTTKNTDTPKDLVYLLLKIFYTETFTIDCILRPEIFSSNIIDYRLPWILVNILTRVHKIRPYSRHMDKVTVSFAHQLESLGLWQWAIYVSLFLKDSHSKEQVIRRLLNVHYPFYFPANSCAHRVSSQLNKEAESSSHQQLYQFLTEKLKISIDWINEALLLRAQYVQDHVLEFSVLQDCGALNRAHLVLVGKLFPFYYVKGISIPDINNYDIDDIIKLEGLINLFDGLQVADWKYGGKILQDYYQIKKETYNIIFEPITNYSTQESARQLLKSYRDGIRRIPELMRRITAFCRNTHAVGVMQLNLISKEYGQASSQAVEICMIDMNSKLSRIITAYEKIQRIGTGVNDVMDMRNVLLPMRDRVTRFGLIIAGGL